MPVARASKAAPSCSLSSWSRPNGISACFVAQRNVSTSQGDQASIVAGAINFVKELEQTLQSLEAQKRGAKRAEQPPFAGFFTFPQYSTTGVVGAGDASDTNNDASSGGGGGDHQQCAPRRGVADIEVAVAESHANVKVLTRRRPRQLLRMLVAMQCLGLTVLHLNVTTTADNLAFYTFSLKASKQRKHGTTCCWRYSRTSHIAMFSQVLVIIQSLVRFCSQMEDECRLSSVDEIATAVNEILAKIAEEGAACQ